MGTVQALTDQMIASSVNNKEPTSEDTLHHEAVEKPENEVSIPLESNPNVYTTAQTIHDRKAAEDSAVKNPLMQIPSNKLYAGNPNIGRATIGSWAKLYSDPNKQFVYDDRLVEWIRDVVVKDELTDEDLDELSAIGIEQPKLVEAYPDLFDGIILDETEAVEDKEDESEIKARKERIKLEAVRIFDEMPKKVKAKKITGKWRETKGTVIPTTPPPPPSPTTPMVTVHYTNGSTGVMTQAMVQDLIATGGLAANSIVNYTLGATAPAGTVTAPNITPQTPGITPSPTEMPVANVVAAINANAPANAPIITLPQATAIATARTAAIQELNTGAISKATISPDSSVITTVGLIPTDITTAKVDKSGTTTTKSDTGTIVTTPSGAVTVTPATPPTVNPVNKTTDNYYVFTNSINTQEVDVSASQWNSWTPQQQFNFLKSIGALVPNDITANNNATFVSNKDGTWSITTPTPQGFGYSRN